MCLSHIDTITRRLSAEEAGWRALQGVVRSAATISGISLKAPVDETKSGAVSAVDEDHEAVAPDVRAVLDSAPDCGAIVRRQREQMQRLELLADQLQARVERERVKVGRLRSLHNELFHSLYNVAFHDVGTGQDAASLVHAGSSTL